MVWKGKKVKGRRGKKNENRIRKGERTRETHTKIGKKKKTDRDRW